jgi:hypothetical protein
MDYSGTPPIEQAFVVRMGNCIRLYNAGQADENMKIRFESELKIYGEERKRLEHQIGEKYRVDYPAYKKIVGDLFEEMNAADRGFSRGEGSPMWERIDEFITKFKDAIQKLTAEEDNGL